MSMQAKSMLQSTTKSRLVLQAPNGAAIADDVVQQVADEVGGSYARMGIDGVYSACVVATDRPIDKQRVAEMRRARHVDHNGEGSFVPFDINLLPRDFDPFQVKMIVTDMDSTLIAIECIDEIADLGGLKPQVADITERAMRGELDFCTSLRQRVALLKGMEERMLQKVFDERLVWRHAWSLGTIICLYHKGIYSIPVHIHMCVSSSYSVSSFLQVLTCGAEEMISRSQERGIRSALVSGGFTFFTDRLRNQLHLHYSRANKLEIDNHTLTGGLIGDIVCAKSKAAFLREVCAKEGIECSQAVAVGDGANDLLMLGQAGLSVAFHAKKVVAEGADTALLHCGLEGLLGLLGIDDQRELPNQW